MRVVFWLSFFVILYAFVGYPVVLMLLSLKKRNKETFFTSGIFVANVSMIIPVYNEEKIIEEKIKNTLLLDYPKDRIEILIVSDASNDRTREVVLNYEKEGVKYFQLPERKGKAGTLNRGLLEAKNEIVVFCDASIILASNALRSIVHKFADQEIGCVSGEDHIAGGGEEGAYGKYELFLRNLESRIGSIVGASGCFYAQRRRLCEPFPEGLAPDFFSVLKTVEKGFRAVTERGAKGYMRSVANPKSEFERKVRTLIRGITTLFMFKKILNPFRYGIFSIQLISHKLIRWSVGFLMVLLLVSNLFLLSSEMYFFLFCLQAAFYLLAGIGWMNISSLNIFRIPFFFSLVNLSAIVAWAKYFSGNRQEIWQPSKR